MRYENRTTPKAIDSIFSFCGDLFCWLCCPNFSMEMLDEICFSPFSAFDTPVNACNIRLGLDERTCVGSRPIDASDARNILPAAFEPIEERWNERVGGFS